MKRILSLFLALAVSLAAQNVSTGPVVKKTSGANKNDIVEDLNIGAGRTAKVYDGGTFTRQGTGVVSLNATLQALSVTNGQALDALAAVSSNGVLMRTGANTYASGAVPVNLGGTNLTSYTTGDMLYASGSAALSRLAAVATGSVLVSNGVGSAPVWSNNPTFAGGLTVTGAVTFRNGGVSMTLGADAGAATITNSTQKSARLVIPHYLNAEEPFGVFFADATVSANTLSIGGGTSQVNAATSINLYTAADSITTTGTIGATLNNNGLYVFNILRAQFGGTSMLVGANGGGAGLTDAVDKQGRIGLPHYTNAEEAVALIYGTSGVSTNAVNIGGGTASFNAATVLQFFTAADNITTTGTVRMAIDNAGQVRVFTTTAASNTTTGALRVDGGLGVAGSGFFGGQGAFGGASLFLTNVTVNGSAAMATVANGTGTASFTIAGDAGTSRLFQFGTGGAGNANRRWQVLASSQPEAGSNAGSAFVINAMDDSGNLIDSTFTITRATGGSITLFRPTVVSSTLDTTSTSTGALQVFGGVGVTKNLNVGQTVVIGTTGARSDSKLYVGGTPGYNAGFSTGIAAVITNWDPSQLTVGGTVFDAYVTISDIAATTPKISAVRANGGVVGASAIVTDYLAFDANGIPTGGTITNAKAFRANFAAATGRWNLYIEGTAQNYLAGNTGLGTAAVSTARLVVAASTTSIAPVNLGQGTAPTSPVNGDLWVTSSGVYARVNGATVQLN